MNTASGMIGNFLEQLPYLMAMLDTIIAVIGVSLMAYSVYAFINAADAKQKRHSLINGRTSYFLIPFGCLLAGVMMWNRVLTAGVMLSTIYGDGMTTNTLLDYPGSGFNDEFDKLVTAISLIFRVFGYYLFFIKGWMKFRKFGDEGVFKEASTYIFFGTFLINNVATVNGLSQLFGFGSII
ncbi:hypothetical protein AADX40_15555 [Aeromonas veronii]|uniref:hypothetical protein n=1 Tax=Aeromonas TaxID=642 RepID=UPI003158E1A3